MMNCIRITITNVFPCRTNFGHFKSSLTLLLTFIDDIGANLIMNEAENSTNDRNQIIQVCECIALDLTVHIQILEQIWLLAILFLSLFLFRTTKCM